MREREREGVCVYIYIWCSAARPPLPPHPMVCPPSPPVVPCGVGSPPGCGRLRPPWLLLVGRPVAKGLDLRLWYSSTELRPALSSKANDSDECYGDDDDDDEDGVVIPIRNLLRSLAQESRMKIIQTRAQAYL